ncbi:HepT-like ribonuclease domain-containing protein [Janibacter anophelis]|uniref:HepT-like ribonuclease domain-containing protein n=1 Tax=Janibacter anophelis TaxID=319054 RepID=UPI0030B806FB
MRRTDADRLDDIAARGAAGMRDFLAHHYFATRPDIIQLPIDKRLPSLAAAVARLQDEAREH